MSGRSGAARRSSSSGSCARARWRCADVAAGVDDEPVQPGRELRLAAELLDPHAELRERLLRRVLRILRIREQVPRQPLDPRRVARAERLERPGVAVLCARDQDRIAQPVVGERGVGAKLMPDSTAATGTGLHAGPSVVRRCSSSREAGSASPSDGSSRARRRSACSTARPRARSSPRTSRPPGRGRLGRAWEAPKGAGLLFSIVLTPRVDARAAARAHRRRRRGRVRGDLPARRGFPRASSRRTTCSSAAGRWRGSSPRPPRDGSCSASASTSARARPSSPRTRALPATSLALEGAAVERGELLATILEQLEQRYDRWVNASVSPDT